MSTLTFQGVKKLDTSQVLLKTLHESDLALLFLCVCIPTNLVSAAPKTTMSFRCACLFVAFANKMTILHTPWYVSMIDKQSDKYLLTSFFGGEDKGTVRGSVNYRRPEAGIGSRWLGPYSRGPKRGGIILATVGPPRLLPVYIHWPRNIIGNIY